MKKLTFNAGALRCRIFAMMGGLTLLATSIHAQDSPLDRIGIPEDWTHHHVVFTEPGTAEQALQSGDFDRWVRIVNDPRYQLQRAKRLAVRRLPASSHDPGSNTGLDVNSGEADAPPNQAALLQLPR